MEKARQFLKSKSGSILYVITSDSTHQAMGFHKSEKSSQILLQGESGNEMAVKLLRESKEVEETTEQHVREKLLQILKSTVSTCEFHGVKIPGMDQIKDYLKAKKI